MTKNDKTMNELIDAIAKSFKFCKDTSIDECHTKVDCHHCLSEQIYNAGYRKQIEGENSTENHPVDEFICSECGLIMRDCGRYEIDEDDGDEILYEFAFRFCPRCGMKVRGD